MSTTDAKVDIWAVLERGAEDAKSLPEWTIAEFNVNPVNFTMYSDDGSGPAPTPHAATTNTKK